MTSEGDERAARQLRLLNQNAWESLTEREGETEREREGGRERGREREREREGSGGRTEGLAQSAAISMVLPTLTSEGALTVVDIVRRRFVWLALPPYPGAFCVNLWAPRT